PVQIRAPPEHAFAAGLVQIDGAAGDGKAEVHRRQARGNARERAVPDDAPGEVLVETEVDEGPDEVARLRVADRHDVADETGDGIRGAGCILRVVAEEGDEIANGRQA